ncbi:MAG: hypothetical protein ACD_29C00355G0005 [uncultured bacterium]|nr:MAG: hypothetical protein ACD_29C00355G0005 [uncultured bacterium]
MTSYSEIILPDFEQSHVLVYGDVMLDRYWHGDATRISPEAPVAVVNVLHTEVRPGGAANVAQNIASLGAKVTLCGLVGEDTQAEELKNCLDQLLVNCQFLSVPHFPTITKLRVMGRHQQLIRMDFENEDVFKEIEDDMLFKIYCDQLENNKNIKLVVLSDYSKGALCHVERLIAIAKKAGAKILVDPKHKDYARYAGATILTPNLKEFESVVGKCADLQEMIQKAKTLLLQINVESILVTLGKDGMIYVDSHSEGKHFPTKAQDVFDVTGAGDTVIGVVAAGLAANMDILSAIELANIAAGIVVGKLGAQAVSVLDLQQALALQHDLFSAVLNENQLAAVVKKAKLRGEKIIMTNGCFDILHVGHVDYLTKAKALGDRLIVAVNSDESVRALKGDNRPFNKLSARMAVLAGLKSVDWVVGFSEGTPARLIHLIKPDVLVKGSDYKIEQIAGSESVIAHGGEVITIPLVDGFSTTGLIEKIQEVKV